MKRWKRLTIFRVALVAAAVAVVVPATALAKPMPLGNATDYEIGPGGIVYAEHGYPQALPVPQTTVQSPDDRSFSRMSNDEVLVATDDGWSLDVNPYAGVGGLALVLLAGGMGIAIRQSRKTKLSPA